MTVCGGLMLRVQLDGVRLQRLPRTVLISFNMLKMGVNVAVLSFNITQARGLRMLGYGAMTNLFG